MAILGKKLIVIYRELDVKVAKVSPHNSVLDSDTPEECLRDINGTKCLGVRRLIICCLPNPL